MSKQILSISEAREKLPQLPKQFEDQPGVVVVTHNGKPVMTVLPYNTYKFLLETVDSLRETIKTLQDAE